MTSLSTVNLSALRAVEVVARHGTLREAADELGVTPGAVSQQILKAEQQLGRMLFDRRPSGMVPTALGTDIAAHLSEGFAALSRGVALAQQKSDDAITVSVAPVFAAKWLVPRLGGFADLHPDIRVRIDASTVTIDPKTGGVDACIRVGTGDWPGLRCEDILPQRVMPVCAPRLAEQLHDIADLTRVPIIRERSNTLFDWDVWLTPNDMTKDQLGAGPVFSDASLCLDAAIAGQGVYLGLEVLAQDALSRGQLVAPFPGRFRTGVSYWFVEPEGVRRPKTVEAFRTWLTDALRASRST